MQKIREVDNMKISTDKMVYKCLECGLINVYPTRIPIGYAAVNRDCDNNTINIGVKVDTTELDKALKKARELNDIIDGLKYKQH